MKNLDMPSAIRAIANYNELNFELLERAVALKDVLNMKDVEIDSVLKTAEFILNTNDRNCNKTVGTIRNSLLKSNVGIEIW